MMSGRNTAVILASVGAGTLASGYLLSDSTAAAERRKLYPPRYVYVWVVSMITCTSMLPDVMIAIKDVKAADQL